MSPTAPPPRPEPPQPHGGYLSEGYPLPQPPAPHTSSRIDKLPDELRAALAERYAAFALWLNEPCTRRFLAYAAEQSREAAARGIDLNRGAEVRTIEAAAAMITDRIADGRMFMAFYEADKEAFIEEYMADVAARRIAEDVIHTADRGPGTPARRQAGEFGI